MFDGMVSQKVLKSKNYVGGGGETIASALKLSKQAVNIAVNWAGVLYCAKKSEYSEFCYFNDIVQAIIEQL